MSISIKLTAAVVLVAVSLTSLEASAAEAPSRKPNVIFILADDLGYADLGCYGQQKIRTPHIDRLAAEGMRFTQHYSGAPVCAPSRCALLTGFHTGHGYIRDNGELPTEGQRPIPDSTVTLAPCFAAQRWARASMALLVGST